MRALTEHLAAASTATDRPAFIAGPRISPDSMERFAGYREALRAAGLPAPRTPDAIGDFTEAGGARAVQALLDAPQLPDGDRVRQRRDGRRRAAGAPAHGRSACRPTSRSPASTTSPSPITSVPPHHRRPADARDRRRSRARRAQPARRPGRDPTRHRAADPSRQCAAAAAAEPAPRTEGPPNDRHRTGRGSAHCACGLGAADLPPPHRHQRRRSVPRAARAVRRHRNRRDGARAPRLGRRSTGRPAT